MLRKVYEVDNYDLSVSGSTKPAPLNGKGPISIQPVLTSLTGTPTYTLEMSNDGENFVEYDPLSTNKAIDVPIQINYDTIPWEYLRFTITSTGGDSGIVRFKVYQHE